MNVDWYGYIVGYSVSVFDLMELSTGTVIRRVVFVMGLILQERI